MSQDEENMVPRQAFRELKAERDRLEAIADKLAAEAEGLTLQTADDYKFGLYMADELANMTAERDALRSLVLDIHRALEFARTRERTPWAYEWLFGKKSKPRKHEALVQLDKVVEQLKANTAVPATQPDPPYPHRTQVCTRCGTAVHEDDIADGGMCHICFKS